MFKLSKLSKITFFLVCSAVCQSTFLGPLLKAQCHSKRELEYYSKGAEEKQNQAWCVAIFPPRDASVLQTIQYIIAYKQVNRAPNMAIWRPLLICSCLCICHMHQVALFVILKALINISDPHLTARIIFLIPLRWNLHHIPLSGDVEVPGKHDDNKPFDKDNKMLENGGGSHLKSMAMPMLSFVGSWFMCRRSN